VIVLTRWQMQRNLARVSKNKNIHKKKLKQIVSAQLDQCKIHEGSPESYCFISGEIW